MAIKVDIAARGRPRIRTEPKMHSIFFDFSETSSLIASPSLHRPFRLLPPPSSHPLPPKYLSSQAILFLSSTLRHIRLLPFFEERCSSSRKSQLPLCLDNRAVDVRAARAWHRIATRVIEFIDLSSYSHKYARTHHIRFCG